MKKINFVVDTDRELVIAYRGNKHAFAKPVGDDEFSVEKGKDIASKKLRMKEVEKSMKEKKKQLTSVLDQIKELERKELKLADQILRMSAYHWTLYKEYNNNFIGD